MQDPNYSLFDEEAFKDVARKNDAGLAIRKGNRKKLSKAQNEFNRLTKRIEQVQRQLQTNTMLYDELLEDWSREMPGLDASFAQWQLDVALALDRAGKRFTYGKVQSLKLRFTIITLLREAFSVIEATEAGEQVFDRWNGVSLRETAQQEFDEMKDAMEQGFREAFGIDMDLGDMEDSEESFARFAAEFEQHFSEMNRDDPRQARNIAKDIQAELAEKAHSERVKRSIRTVYLNIAKALHPDTTLDEAERLRRDDVMKTVTVAYQNQDLQALLRIEMIEMERGAERINFLPDETLAMYNHSLREQVNQLEAELRELRNHPRYLPIAPLLTVNPDYARRSLERDIMKMQQTIFAFEQTAGLLEDDPSKEIVMAVLEKFCSEYDEEFAEWSGRPLKGRVNDFRRYWYGQF
ncbi:MAG: hypothetical protein M5R41_06195 [Bacteroidia bacterium]|nr:hypothetical protein [Bacteroidia bacterium]